MTAERIAEDVVQHFNGRGFLGKAMVVSVDKATAVRMYDKVQACWAAEIERLQQQLPASVNERRAEIERELAFMRQTDMAVVVSQSQGEVAEFRKKAWRLPSTAGA